MPVLRKLSPEEVETLERKPTGERQLIREQYDELLREFGEGDFVEAELDAEEKRQTVKNRLQAAAERRGLSLKFRRAPEDMLSFQVVAGEAGEEEEPVEYAVGEGGEAARSGNGRRRRGKQAAEQTA